MLPLLVITLFQGFVTAIPAAQAASSSVSKSSTTTASSVTATCSGNTASDRSVWCDYDLSTDYYNDGPTTGVIQEYWFELVNITASPDGVSRDVLTVNGTIPGPTIEANWGDTVVVHVTNNLATNGTGIHWHGIRQNWTNSNDGVPSIVQCPVAPGESMTYTWKAEQYGTSWYHSHFSLQAWEGVHGPIIIHGPASANYDEEFGTVLLTDWTHETCDALYIEAEHGPPELDTGLINGLNVWDGAGSRFDGTFESGMSYLLRLVNTAIDTHFKFMVDNHTMTVIAADFVPIVPYTTEVLDINMGQRYDVVISAEYSAGDYWMRAIPQSACSSNANPNNITGIIRYDSSSTADPTTSAYGYTNECVDEDMSNLVPYMSKSVGSDNSDDELPVATVQESDGLFKWYIGTTSMVVDWADPTLLQIYEGTGNWTDQEAVIELPDANTWAYFIIETTLPVPHPIHLHGHDFYILAQDTGTYDSSVTLSTSNPPRRDVVTLPASGYVVIAFYTDNPGAWLMHCHIGWHTSEGLALQFIERQSDIAALIDVDALNGTCAAWDKYQSADDVVEFDSGV